MDTTWQLKPDSGFLLDSLSSDSRTRGRRLTNRLHHCIARITSCGDCCVAAANAPLQVNRVPAAHGTPPDGVPVFWSRPGRPHAISRTAIKLRSLTATASTAPVTSRGDLTESYLGDSLKQSTARQDSCGDGRTDKMAATRGSTRSDR